MSCSLRLAALPLLGLFLAWYGTTQLSISPEEAALVFHGEGPLTLLLHGSLNLLGMNDLGLRLPFILIHLANVALVYRLARFYLDTPCDQTAAAALFALLPGVNSAALVADMSGIVILATLLILYYYHVKRQAAYLLLIAAAFLDGAFLVLFLSLFAYGIYKKSRSLSAVSGGAFALNYARFGFDPGGLPEGYFLDIFGTYGAVFSPLVFLYFIYVLYGELVRSKQLLSPLWFVAFGSFALALVLSLRQKIPMEDFAPFAVIAAPLIAGTFFHAYRVRMPRFRRGYNTAAALALGLLLLNTGLTFFNKPFYLLVDNPRHHFAYNYHFARDLAEALKAKGIEKVLCDDEKMQLRLAFYGVGRGGGYRLGREGEGETVLLSNWGVPVTWRLSPIQIHQDKGDS